MMHRLVIKYTKLAKEHVKGRKTMIRRQKLLSGLLSATMVAGIVPASIAYAGTITVANQDPGTDENTAAETYGYYKIFEAVKATTGSGITYKIHATDPWFSVLFDEQGSPVDGNTWFTATAIPGESGAYEVNASFTGDAKDCADWLMENKGDITATSLAIGANTVDDGYYLVQSSLGANLGLATTDIGMDIVDKNTYPSIDKRQNDDGADGTYADDLVNVAVGDSVFYDFIVYVPASADKDITVVDTMSAGITYDATAGVTAGGLSETADGTFSGDVAAAAYAVTDTEDGFTLTIHPNDLLKGKYVEFKFQGTINASAITEDTDQKNTATLTYSNYTQTDSVAYATGATGAQKYDGSTADFIAADNTLAPRDNVTDIVYLADAEFELQKTDGTRVPVVKMTDATNGDYYRPAITGETAVPIVTDSDGRFDIRGLDLDDDVSYQLVETKAPNGYHLLTAPAQLVLMGNNANTTGHAVNEVAEIAIKKIANEKGSLLPTTGGIGTVIVYVVGGVLIAVAATVLVVKFRKGQSSEEE